MDHERRRYLFAGRVQGVGFRMTTRRIAGAHPVTGTVRNLPDGRVEVVVDGEPAAIAAFVEAIGREFEGYIQEVEHARVPADDTPFEGFSIRL